jgi:hypothetical protein
MGEKLDWTGDWSASSSKWSPELKQHLQYNQTYREGSYTFYMSLDDYISYFNSTCIVKIHNSPKSQQLSPYNKETLRLSHSNDSYALGKFTVSAGDGGGPSERIYLTVHQISKHLVPESDKYELSKARIVVGKVISTLNLEYIKAKNGYDEDLTLELTGLKPGSYIVFLQLDWVAPAQVSSFILSAFSD